MTATRIVGGDPATRDEYPWQAALFLAADDAFICGGSLINNKYILTVAHCVSKYSDPAELTVRLREHNINKPDQAKEINLNVAEIILHKNFAAPSVRYDIALLKLETPLSLSQLATVRPICLPSTRTELYEREKAIATGWGRTQLLSDNSNVLREVKLRVITNSRCRKSDAYEPSMIRKNMLCAGNEDKNICLQDEGGPLAYLNSDGLYEQIGITSFGFECGAAEEPSVFSRVNKFLRWIERKAVGATYCSGFSFP